MNAKLELLEAEHAAAAGFGAEGELVAGEGGHFALADGTAPEVGLGKEGDEKVGHLLA